MLFLLLALWTCQAAAAVTLFNGGQEVVFNGAPAACLAVFNAQLSCSSFVQKLSYDVDKLSPTRDDLTSLCTTSCAQSLTQLKQSLSSSCETWEFYFNDSYMNLKDVLDLYQYKFDGFCLRNTAGDFCLVVEETWDVGALDRAGTATWPAYSNKTYPNWIESDDGSPTVDIDGTLLDDFDEEPSGLYDDVDLPKSATDFYMDGLSPNWMGHGWDGMLEYDEYPLEIQCSECFLAQYKHGIESKWGEMYDEVSAQVWDNMKNNCKLTWDLNPANNRSQPGLHTNITALVWDRPITCAQNISRPDQDLVTCSALGLQWHVPSASISRLNSVVCAGVSNGTFCAPAPCDVTLVPSETNAGAFLKAYDNITMTQLMTWNPYINSRSIRKSEVVCVGPPGGNYIPVSTTVAPANPTSFTTTATPGAPTPSGTVRNCGKYYTVRTGQSCDAVSIANGLTFADLRAMNPSLDAQCSNLVAGDDYCVALVDGTSVTSPGTGTPTEKCNPSAPLPTQSGGICGCNAWHQVVSESTTCDDIIAYEHISEADFRLWNPKLGTDCKLQVGSYTCVGVVPEPCNASAPSPTQLGAVM